MSTCPWWSQPRSVSCHSVAVVVLVAFTVAQLNTIQRPHPTSRTPDTRTTPTRPSPYQNSTRDDPPILETTPSSLALLQGSFPCNGISHYSPFQSRVLRTPCRSSSLQSRRLQGWCWTVPKLLRVLLHHAGHWAIPARRCGKPSYRQRWYAGGDTRGPR